MTSDAGKAGAPSEPLGPATVATDLLKPNPHNPRVLFDELPLKILEQSIQKVGILVPLTVFKARGSDHHTILDGQRRWICAQRLQMPEVPINEVREPTTAENIVTMFQIHKLRQDWELMPTALKLGVLMQELQERRDKPLAELTGLDVAVVTRCKKLLWYPTSYQEMMPFADPADRVKADFFIELYPILTDRFISKLEWYKRATLIDRFLFKYQNRLSGFRSVTDFRKIKQFTSIARAAGEGVVFAKHFKAFVFDDAIDISHLEIGTARIHREAGNLIKVVGKLCEDLQKIDTTEFFGEEELWDELERLLVLIRRKLASADRRPL
jgi:ParB family transcriptional regulator, chromosome partitioning protein